MVIRALDHVGRCYSIADGTVIAGVLRSAFVESDRVVLSFAGVSDVPSSFINSALVVLLHDYPPVDLKRRLSIIDATPQIADMVRRCVANGERALAA